jgi:UDP-N-acetylglucosamine:LPS N-acetylglucosamine transferase
MSITPAISEDDVRDRRVRLLAVASGGGHWEQLMQLRSVLERFSLAVAVTDVKFAQSEGFAEAYAIQDSNRSTPLAALRTLRDAVRTVLRVRPDCIVTTGAMPGLFCLAVGRLIGAKTIWLDSIANSERLSVSGRLSALVAHHRLTQWEHLARGPRLTYAGSLL